MNASTLVDTNLPVFQCFMVEFQHLDVHVSVLAFGGGVGGGGHGSVRIVSSRRGRQDIYHSSNPMRP